jgi:hypothetical protein
MDATSANEDQVEAQAHAREVTADEDKGRTEAQTHGGEITTDEEDQARGGKVEAVEDESHASNAPATSGIHGCGWQQWRGAKDARRCASDEEDGRDDGRVAVANVTVGERRR